MNEDIQLKRLALFGVLDMTYGAESAATLK